MIKLDQSGAGRGGGGNGLQQRISEASSRPAPRGFPRSLTRLFKITEMFSSRKIQLLALIIGASDQAMSVLCPSSPNWQFPAASSPQISEKEGPRPCKRLRTVYLIFFKQTKQKLICLLGNTVAAKWPGSPTGFCDKGHPLATTASIVSNQGTNCRPRSVPCSSR